MSALKEVRKKVQKLIVDIGTAPAKEALRELANIRATLDGVTSAKVSENGNAPTASIVPQPETVDASCHCGECECQREENSIRRAYVTKASSDIK